MCDFDMLFTFVYSGWKGTTNDSKVFLNALKPENNFPKPSGGNVLLHYYCFFLPSLIISYMLSNIFFDSMADQFYLFDSGFPNMSGYLAPFHSARYHLRDFHDRRQA